MLKMLPRLAAILAVGWSVSACSSVPDWVDPTTWFDGSPRTADEGGQAPDLADIPNKPQASTPDDQKQVADSLAADRAQTNYSAEQLQAGDEKTAPPPADAPPPGTHAAAHTNTEVDAEASTSTPVSDTTANSSATSTTSPAPSQSVPAPSRTRVATAEPPPALPKQSVATTSAPAAASDSDAALGFKPSAAPPLDPSVAQFVSPSVLSQYHQTASVNADSSSAASDVAPTKQGRHRHRKSDAGVGGPEQMSGDVVANMNALDAPTSAPLTAYADASGNPPAAVVFFPGDGATLNAASRAKVKEVVQAYQAKGSQGFIRVVGHSSSRTPNMPVEKHLELIFQRSQDRANAVAHELIREGVPADKVLVDAVGDSQPVYYESMPKGEEGNRRAEIFLQS